MSFRCLNVRCQSRVDGWETEKQPYVHAGKDPWQAAQWPLTELQCGNKYANKVINNDIRVRLITCQKKHVYGYKIFGEDHCSCAGAVTHHTNSWCAVPLWSRDIQTR